MAGILLIQLLIQLMFQPSNQRANHTDDPGD